MEADSKKSFDVVNPYNGEFVAKTSNCSVKDAEKAVGVAREAFYKWSLETTAKQRGLYWLRGNGGCF